jgi:hypothetical protein
MPYEKLFGNHPTDSHLPLPPNYALHTLEEGEFFRKYVKWRQIVNGVLQEWPKACFSDENYVDFFELFMYGL